MLFSPAAFPRAFVSSSSIASEVISFDAFPKIIPGPLVRNKALTVSAREVTEKRLHETSIVPIEESDGLKGGMAPLDHRPWPSEVSCKNLGRGNLEISDQNQNFGALIYFKYFRTRQRG